LPDHVLLKKDLDRSVARSVKADLRSREEAEAELEADLRPAIEAEEIGRQIPEITRAQRTREAVGDTEGGLMAREPERCGQVDDGEIRLRTIHLRVRVVLARQQRGVSPVVLNAPSMGIVLLGGSLRGAVIGQQSRRRRQRSCQHAMQEKEASHRMSQLSVPSG
jgi:hypothetical protein